jgi:hypothetical protein
MIIKWKASESFMGSTLGKESANLITEVRSKNPWRPSYLKVLKSLVDPGWLRVNRKPVRANSHADPRKYANLLDD